MVVPMVVAVDVGVIEVIEIVGVVAGVGFVDRGGPR